MKHVFIFLKFLSEKVHATTYAGFMNYQKFLFDQV